MIKKILGILIVLLTGMLVSCEIGDGNFTTGPVLTLSWDAAASVFTYSFEHSEPRAESYVVYWRTGERTLDEVRGRNPIESSDRTGTINPSADTNTISAVVEANAGGSKAYSEVKQASKSGGGGDGQPMSVVQAKSAKRGVGYNFTTLNSTNKNSTAHTAKDMDLLMSGTGGICWFYSWGPAPNATVETQARQRGLEFAPMAWNGGFNADAIENFVKNNPQAKYLLGFNEPNFLHQSNMTPTEAATQWTRFRDLAKKSTVNKKIVSPAMNYSGGNESMGWNDPRDWLDAFRAAIGETAWDEIDAIAVHSYPWWPGAGYGHVKDYAKYGKKIWLTEFCGWEDLQDWRTSTPELQAWYMSQLLIALEADPLVERYAWYLPKGHVAQNLANPTTGPDRNRNPYHHLLTDTTSATPPRLTDLGVIFTNIPSLDRSVWYLTGEKIDASQFMNSNLADSVIQSRTWRDSVLFRPVTDTDKSAGVLEIFDMKNAMWVEYQIEAPTSKTYYLSIRYMVPPLSNGNPINNNTMRISVDGALLYGVGPITSTGDLVLPTTDWTTVTGIPLNLSAGNHTIRLATYGGANNNFALNWFMVE